MRADTSVRRLVTSAILCVPLVAACAERAAVAGPIGAGDARSAVRLRDCDAAPIDLPPALAAALPRASGSRTPDDAWADLARTTPGGFAGVLYDKGRAALLLTDPTQAAAARAALAPRFPGFDIAGAEVRRVRWNFAQLVDWYDHLAHGAALWQDEGITFADRDEAANRIRLGAADAAARDRLVARLATLDLPCDLVIVEVRGRASSLGR